MKEIFKFVDKLIRRIIGLPHQEILPDVIKVGKKIKLISVESHKRHIYTQDLDKFLDEEVNKLNKTTKEKLGLSLGKALRTFI